MSDLMGIIEKTLNMEKYKRIDELEKEVNELKSKHLVREVSE